MADMDEMATCQVCFVEYSLTGDQVPRILPCFHTMCESCITDILEIREELKCPECKALYPAPNGAKTFPQNKYIVNHLRKMAKIESKTESAEEKAVASVEGSEDKENNKEARKEDVCREHKKDIVLFCNDCKTPLCLDCLTNYHNKHDVVSIETERERAEKERVEKREELLKNLKEELEDLTKTREAVTETHQKAKKLSTDATRKIRLQRETIIKEISKKFEKITAVVKAQIEDTEKNANESVENIDKRMKVLQEMEAEVKASPEKDVSAELKQFHEMKKEILLTEEAMGYTNFDVEPIQEEDIKTKLYGDLTSGTLPINLPTKKEDILNAIEEQPNFAFQELEDPGALLAEPHCNARKRATHPIVVPRKSIRVRKKPEEELEESKETEDEIDDDSDEFEETEQEETIDNSLGASALRCPLSNELRVMSRETKNEDATIATEELSLSPENRIAAKEKFATETVAMPDYSAPFLTPHRKPEKLPFYVAPPIRKPRGHDFVPGTDAVWAPHNNELTEVPTKQTQLKSKKGRGEDKEREETLAKGLVQSRSQLGTLGSNKTPSHLSTRAAGRTSNTGDKFVSEHTYPWVENTPEFRPPYARLQARHVLIVVAEDPCPPSPPLQPGSLPWAGPPPTHPSQDHLPLGGHPPLHQAPSRKFQTRAQQHPTLHALPL